MSDFSEPYLPDPPSGCTHLDEGYCYKCAKEFQGLRIRWAEEMFRKCKAIRMSYRYESIFKNPIAITDTLHALGFKDRFATFKKEVANDSVLGQIRKVWRYIRVELLPSGQIVREIEELERLLRPEAPRESGNREELGSTSAGNLTIKAEAAKGVNPCPDGRGS